MEVIRLRDIVVTVTLDRAVVSVGNRQAMLGEVPEKTAAIACDDCTLMVSCDPQFDSGYGISRFHS